MDSLDFGQLSDDQLITLLRATLQECVARDPAVVAAAQSAVLEESEKAQVRSQAAETEAAAMRAEARAKVAREAAEEIRAKKAAEDAQVAELRGKKDAAEAVERAAKKTAAERDWLSRAAALVGKPAHAISIVLYNGRILINEGGRYEQDHLVDWSVVTNKISTVRELIGRKPELIGLCAEFRAAAVAKLVDTYLTGREIYEEVVNA